MTKPKFVEINQNKYDVPEMRSVRPLMLQDKSNPHYPGVLGSSTMIRRNNRFYIVCTRHQLKLSIGDEARVNTSSSPLFISHTSNGELKNIPVSKFFFATDSNIHELHEILCFEAVVEEVHELNEAKNFYPLESLPSGELIDSLCVGCPSNLLQISYDPLNIIFKTAAVGCKYQEHMQINHLHFHRYSYDIRTLDDVNGLSGGAIFSMYSSPTGVSSFLSGIVTRGGNGNLYVIDAIFVSNMIDYFD